MSRWVWRVLAGVGCLAIVAAVVLRLAIAPHVAQSPLLPGPAGFVNHVSIGTVTALLDLETGVAREPIRVTRTETTRGDAAAAAQAAQLGFNVSVLDTISRVVGPDQKVIREDSYRMAPDRRSGALADCCGVYVGGVTVPMGGAGYPLRLPPLPQASTYPYFDVNLLAAVPMKYLGEDQAGGLPAMKFQQATPPTKAGRLVVPGRLVGAGDRPTTADRYYSATRTLWVDPVSGIVLRKSERTRETVRDASGRDVVTLYSAVLDSSAEQTAQSAAQARAAAAPIRWTRTLGPALLLTLGLGLLLAAWAGLMHARRMDQVLQDFPDRLASFDDITAEPGEAEPPPGTADHQDTVTPPAGPPGSVPVPGQAPPR